MARADRVIQEAVVVAYSKCAPAAEALATPVRDIFALRLTAVQVKSILEAWINAPEHLSVALFSSFLTIVPNEDAWEGQDLGDQIDAAKHTFISWPELRNLSSQLGVQYLDLAFTALGPGANYPDRCPLPHPDFDAAQ